MFIRNYISLFLLSTLFFTRFSFAAAESFARIAGGAGALVGGAGLFFIGSSARRAVETSNLSGLSESANHAVREASYAVNPTAEATIHLLNAGTHLLNAGASAVVAVTAVHVINEAVMPVARVVLPAVAQGVQDTAPVVQRALTSAVRIVPPSDRKAIGVGATALIINKAIMPENAQRVGDITVLAATGARIAYNHRRECAIL